MDYTGHKELLLKHTIEMKRLIETEIQWLTKDDIEQYTLDNKATPEDIVNVKIRKGMYGLPQAGLLAQELEKHLNAKGFQQSSIHRTVDKWHMTNSVCPRGGWLWNKMLWKGECMPLDQNNKRTLHNLWRLGGTQIHWIDTQFGLTGGAGILINAGLCR